MSEYQYYEFLALDRPLTPNDKVYIETLSSRVELSLNQAKFVYNYGDFRGNPKEVLERCFDIMLYIANWGSRRIMFRLPKSLIDVAALQAYSLEDKILVYESKNYVILDINIIDEELSGWIDSGEGYLSDIIPLRDDLLRGDYRSLYLAWLKAAPMCVDYKDGEDYIEPPVPPNLNDLSETLSAFINFFEIDQDLIKGAATASKYQEEESESLEDLIPSLSDEERNDFLIRLLNGEPHLSGQLAYRLRELSGKKEVNFDTDTPRRALSELLKIADGETEQRQKQEQEIAHRVKVEKLETLAKKEQKVWNQVFDLIALKQSKPYDQAVAFLLDLRDLAQYQGKLEEFQLAVKQMKKDYSNRPGLISRLQKVGLLEN